jgi:hypothetical protein
MNALWELKKQRIALHADPITGKLQLTSEMENQVAGAMPAKHESTFFSETTAFCLDISLQNPYNFLNLQRVRREQVNFIFRRNTKEAAYLPKYSKWKGKP